MTGSGFVAVPAEGSVLEELAALSPANPFATVRYFEARRNVGDAAWVLGLENEAGALQLGCGAFLRTGRLDRGLEIPSLPAVGAESPFWTGLREFCRAQSVTELELGTFGSPPGTEVPTFGAHGARRSRCEFVLGLEGDLAAALSSNHARNVNKARKAGLSIGRARSAAAAVDHHALIRQSLDRRRLRGEAVGPGGHSREVPALLQSGAGELFQALRDRAVLSSVLVLRARKGGYYHSAGTNSEGMEVGASHFLIHDIACRLKAEGAEAFNLGGAEQGSTLARFKEGFGASPVPLASARWYLGPPWRRWAGRGIDWVRSLRQ